jgi:hypothetical protein
MTAAPCCLIVAEITSDIRLYNPMPQKTSIQIHRTEDAAALHDGAATRPGQEFIKIAAGSTNG